MTVCYWPPCSYWTVCYWRLVPIGQFVIGHLIPIGQFVIEHLFLLDSLFLDTCSYIGQFVIGYLPQRLAPKFHNYDVIPTSVSIPSRLFYLSFVFLVVSVPPQ